MFVKKLWIKFDENADVECWCGKKKCLSDQKPECKEYVVRFVEIDRSEKIEDEVNNIKNVRKQLESKIKKQVKSFETELQKNLRQIKKFKV